MSPVEFKRARPADAPRVLELMREYYAYDGLAWNRRIPSGLRSLLRDPRFGLALLFQVGGESVGYVVMTRGFDLEFGGALGLVTDLYLRPAFRRRGLGAKAIRHLSKVCAAEGLGSIELQVEKKNKKARAFYRAMGFVPHDRVPMSKRLPG